MATTRRKAPIKKKTTAKAAATKPHVTAKTVAPKKQTTAKSAPKTAPVKRTGEKARAKAVKKILLNVEKKMSAKDLRATLGDYIKLLQLQKEMSEQPKTEIRVMWIEEPEESPIEE